MNRRGFLGLLAAAVPVGVLGLPEVKAAPPAMKPLVSGGVEPGIAVISNSSDALIPELWAQESLRVLQENMVMGNLVNRDYERKLKGWGKDRVNVCR